MWRPSFRVEGQAASATPLPAPREPLSRRRGVRFSHLYDDTAFDGRVRGVGNGAWGAYCRMQAWCSQNLTDGYVAMPIARAIATRQQIARLEALGYLQPDPVNPALGVVLADYTAEQLTRTDLEQRRAQWAWQKENQRKGAPE